MDCEFKGSRAGSLLRAMVMVVAMIFGLVFAQNVVAQVDCESCLAGSSSIIQPIPLNYDVPASEVAAPKQYYYAGTSAPRPVANRCKRSSGAEVVTYQVTRATRFPRLLGNGYGPLGLSKRPWFSRLRRRLRCR